MGSPASRTTRFVISLSIATAGPSTPSRLANSSSITPAAIALFDRTTPWTAPRLHAASKSLHRAEPAAVKHGFARAYAHRGVDPLLAMVLDDAFAPLTHLVAANL